METIVFEATRTFYGSTIHDGEIHELPTYDVRLTIKHVIGEPLKTIDLKGYVDDYIVIDLWSDDLDWDSLGAKCDSASAKRVADIWGQYNANNENPGTDRQIKMFHDYYNPLYKYGEADKLMSIDVFLTKNNFLVDRGHEFESENLLEIIPDEIIAELEAIFSLSEVPF